MQEILLDKINSLKLVLANLKEQQDQLIEDLSEIADIDNAILLADTGQQIDQIIELVDNLETQIQAEMPMDTIYSNENEEDDNPDTMLDYTLHNPFKPHNPFKARNPFATC